jgi:ubiquinone/menaquinone biosynthesis C-methylase UbiE
LSHEHGHGHGHDHDHARDHLGNPEDLAAYLEKLEGADRVDWQRPDAVVEALRVRRGDVVCDVGAGPGYFALRLAKAVGPEGRVYAIDAEPRMLELLRQRMAEAGLDNVHPLLADDGAVLPPEPCSRILIVNAFHHFPRGADYLRALGQKLLPGGTLVNIDFHGGELPVGPPADHKVPREDFVRAATEAGLRVVAEETFLPYQYFIALAP